MAVDTSLTVSLAAYQTSSSVLDLVTAAQQAPLSLTKNLSLPTGTAANQADRLFSDTRTLAASATEDLDLAGVLTDAFGATLTFARIKLMYIAAAAANTNNVIVGGAAATQFASWVGAATHTVTVRPGGLLLLAAPDATAYTVGAGASDFLRIGNSAAGTSVTYDIVLVGASV